MTNTWRPPTNSNPMWTTHKRKYFKSSLARKTLHLPMEHQRTFTHRFQLKPHFLERKLTLLMMCHRIPWCWMKSKSSLRRCKRKWNENKKKSWIKRKQNKGNWNKRNQVKKNQKKRHQKKKMNQKKRNQIQRSQKKLKLKSKK